MVATCAPPFDKSWIRPCSIQQKLTLNTTNENSLKSPYKKIGNTSECFFLLRTIYHLYFTASF